MGMKAGQIEADHQSTEQMYHKNALEADGLGDVQVGESTRRVIVT
jgi:hypothetical protein